MSTNGWGWVITQSWLSKVRVILWALKHSIPLGTIRHRIHVRVLWSAGKYARLQIFVKTIILCLLCRKRFRHIGLGQSPNFLGCWNTSCKFKGAPKMTGVPLRIFGSTVLILFSFDTGRLPNFLHSEIQIGQRENSNNQKHNDNEVN
jgi:hypothetical protein